MIRRRDFLRSTVAGAGVLLTSSCLPFAEAFDSATTGARIEVLPDELLGTISPNIYGHFTENLSGVVYDGMWVGENSKIANIHGIRKELVDEMRKIKPSVIRFPGGCFADSYDWRDGIGPRSQTQERRPDLPSRSMFVIGASEMRAGDVAATSLPRNMQSSSAVGRHGYPVFIRNSPSSHPVQM